MKIKLIIILSIVFIVIGIWVYFVSQFSDVYKPIKVYSCHKNIEELKNELVKNCNENDDLKVVFTDVIKGKYYAEIKLNDSQVVYHYDVFFMKSKVGVTISIIGAFDETHKLGGYKKNDTGVDIILEKFEERIRGTMLFFD